MFFLFISFFLLLTMFLSINSGRRQLPRLRAFVDDYANLDRMNTDKNGRQTHLGTISFTDLGGFFGSVEQPYRSSRARL